MRKKAENITRIFHWSIACFVLVMLSLGFYMTNTEYALELYQWHKSLGVIFSMIIGIRVYWSLKHPWQSAATLNRNETLARNVIHRLLLIFLIAMPITGLLNSAYSGWSVHLFDLVIIPKNINAAGEVEPFNTTIYETAKLLHRIMAYIFTVLIFLHVAAVLKHHFIDKDNTLIRMLND